MGVFDSIEKKLEGAVQGAFARAFKGDVQPVEITARIHRELDSHAKLLSKDRKLVPNDFTVALSKHDFGRLNPYAKTLTEEITPQVREYASENGYVFNGPITISYVLNMDLPIGKFTIDSKATAGVAIDPAVSNLHPEPPLARPQATPVPVVAAPEPAVIPVPAAAVVPVPVAPVPDPSADTIRPAAATEYVSRSEPEVPASIYVDEIPQLSLEINGVRHNLTPPGFIIGRGTDADVRINDPGISRKHAKVVVGSDGRITIEDLGSTNGIIVNSQRVKAAVLLEGSRVEIGSTRMSVVASHV